jgi:hypothetical protein
MTKQEKTIAVLQKLAQEAIATGENFNDPLFEKMTNNELQVYKQIFKGLNRPAGAYGRGGGIKWTSKRS